MFSIGLQERENLERGIIIIKSSDESHGQSRCCMFEITRMYEKGFLYDKKYNHIQPNLT